MTDDALGRLVASIQSALADVPAASDYRQKRALTKAARVQAECAKAVALDNLADAVRQLVTALTPQENE